MRSELGPHVVGLAAAAAALVMAAAARAQDSTLTLFPGLALPANRQPE